MTRRLVVSSVGCKSLLPVNSGHHREAKEETYQECTMASILWLHPYDFDDASAGGVECWLQKPAAC
jgi:hypothetical protein